jgi:hypothetical protein
MQYTILYKPKFVKEACNYTVSKDLENFVTNNPSAGSWFSVTKVFVTDSWRTAVIVVRGEIY